MKKAKSSNIVKGVGIAMAVGGATAILGGSMMGNTKMNTMKKSATKAMKSVTNFMESM